MLGVRAQTDQPIALAQSNDDLIALWLHDKSANSQKAYRRDVMEFLT